MLGLQLLLRIFQQPERDGVRGFEIINTRAQAQVHTFRRRGGGEERAISKWARGSGEQSTECNVLLLLLGLVKQIDAANNEL